jgi:hypothetical protein
MSELMRNTLMSVYVYHVNWVPCHHSMARPQISDGGDVVQIWKVAVNIFCEYIE